MYWVEEKMLIISDVHYGKAGHFRKSGIPIPGSIHEEDLYRIAHLVRHYDPEEILFLGDLFHSVHNAECDKLKTFLSQLKAKKLLASGNHDVMDPDFYDFMHSTGLYIKRGPFIFQHHPPVEAFEENYVISGHIHPAISIRSGIRQQTKLSCFYFGERYALMPAFGKFTGNYKISYKFNDNIYAVTDEMVLKIDRSHLANADKS